jgi:hypothetical protein
MVIDVDTYERALALAGELSAAPGAGGKPIRLRERAEATHVRRKCPFGGSAR